MSRQLFGTDGMRGVAGSYPLDRATVRAAGKALGGWRRRQGGEEVLIGRDTRESGPWIAAEFARGLSEEGARPRMAGVITTPGVAWLTRSRGFAAGVMISASHNPYQDNGIKIFGRDGRKLPDEEEARLEAGIFEARREELEAKPQRLAAEPHRLDAEPHRLEDDATLDTSYLGYLASTFPYRLEGVRVVLDCGHGAASHLGPALLGRLGADVVAIGASPDGKNINLDCGALHVETLRRRVVEENAAAGFAFDGDADRCIAVSSSGRIVDGDAILLLAARYLRERSRLGGNGGGPLVVATVMSNIGLEKALAAGGIRMIRTPVGDKYVLEEMLRTGSTLGGEQSGHVIFLEQATTGDGLLTALRVLEVMTQTGRTLDELTADLKVFPQLLVNVRVRERRPLADLLRVQSAIRDAETALAGDGRVVVRFSGTEPLARVMVEGPTDTLVESLATRIADSIRDELGG